MKTLKDIAWEYDDSTEYALWLDKKMGKHVEICTVENLRNAAIEWVKSIKSLQTIGNIHLGDRCCQVLIEWIKRRFNLTEADVQ